MLFEHPSDRSLYHPAAWKELGAGVAHRPCWREAPQNWTKEHLLDKTECENKQQPSRKETKLIYVWEKIFVAAFMKWKHICWRLSGFFFSPSVGPNFSCVHFSECIPQLLLDLGWWQNSFRDVSPQVSGLTPSRPCTTIICWFIT